MTPGAPQLGVLSVDSVGMTDLAFAYLMLATGISGLVFPWLINHFREKLPLSPRSRELYLAVEHRFERRLRLSLGLVIFALLWIASEQL